MSLEDPARFAALHDGVVAKVLDRLPDATWVYPGHGKDTTWGPSTRTWRSGASAGW